VIETALTRLMGIRHPVVSAGMARVSQADLVVAVSASGGMGCLGGVSYLPDQLRAELREIRARTDRPYAVNLLLPEVLTSESDSAWQPVRQLWETLRPQDRTKLAGVEALLTPGAVAGQVDVVLDAAPDAVVLTFGTPRWFVEACREKGIKVFALVGSIGKAKEAAAAGVDVIVAQGSEAGGHTGYASTLTLVPGVVDEVSQPVLAGGGIADGRGLAAVLALGAAGAWVGTRFIASDEAFGHPRFKQRVVEGALNQVVVTRSYTGKPLRTFRNRWTDAWATEETQIKNFPAQYAVAGANVETGYQDGDLEFGMMPAGQAIQLIHEVLPAGVIVESMVAEATAILTGLGGPSQD
jgi:NAD(P)H-dependent flavin oxidoreductase YrpB (nitropropane dioxygenase family)